MPKLLDKVKEMGFSHEEAIKILENYKPDDEEEAPEEPDKEEEETDKPDTEEVEDKEDDSEEDSEEEEVKDDDKAKILKLKKDIQEEVIKQLKIKRKTPSKGSIKKKPTIEYGISNKGYEVKTIRKKE